MKPELIVSDWNGTLITDMDDKPVLKQIGIDELAYCAKRLWLWGRAWNLAILKGRLEKMAAQYRDDPQSQAELLHATYDLFNREVINGMPMDRVVCSVDRYAEGAARRLDTAFYEMLEARRSLHVPAGIHTAAYRLGVMATLNIIAPSSRTDSRSRVSWVSGSTMETDKTGDIARRILLKNHDNKRDGLVEYAKQMKLEGLLENAVYMGDDFRDEPCADVVGRFVVAPLALEEYRQHMASKYGAKVRTPSRKRGDVYKALAMD